MVVVVAGRVVVVVDVVVGAAVVAVVGIEGADVVDGIVGPAAEDEGGGCDGGADSSPAQAAAAKAVATTSATAPSGRFINRAANPDYGLPEYGNADAPPSGRRPVPRW